jgi:hypothetical protein
VLTALLALIGVSALFCLLGLATPGWGESSVFKYHGSSTGAMAILSLLLLISSLVLAGLVFLNIIPHPQLPLILVVVLFVSCIFLFGTVGAFINAFTVATSYSASLIMVALSFGYFSSLLSVYWFFGLRNRDGQVSSSSSSSTTTATSKQSRVVMSE